MKDLDPAAHLSTARYGRSIAILAETRSTNDDAKAALDEGAVDGHVVVADRQTAGRGAHGRSWDSPGGTDLYLSIVARLGIAPARIAPLTLAVGLGVARAIEALVDRPAKIKWPNDVLLDDRKCAGILVEASTRGSSLEGVIIGIGIDVNRDVFSDEIAAIATSLARMKGPFDRALVLARVLDAVEEEVDRFVAHGPSAIVDRVASRLAWIGERVECDGFEGTLLGLTGDGALRVRCASTERVLLSGTLRRS